MVIQSINGWPASWRCVRVGYCYARDWLRRTSPGPGQSWLFRQSGRACTIREFPGPAHARRPGRRKGV